MNPRGAVNGAVFDPYDPLEHFVPMQPVPPPEKSTSGGPEAAPGGADGVSGFPSGSAISPAGILAARRLTRSALVAGLVGAVLLWSWGLVPFFPGFWLGLLLIAFPLLSYAQLLLLDDVLPPRGAMYAGTAVTLVALGLVSLVLMEAGATPGGMALLGPITPGTLVIEATGTTLVVLAGMFAARWVQVRLGIRETRLLRAVLPDSRGERWAFAGLSFAAGSCEELAYRGFAMSWITVLTGSFGAGALVTSVAFGALHAYQGMLGAVRAGFLGLILALSVIRTGSLWPAMVAHTALDLLVGLVLTRYLVDPDRDLDSVPLAGRDTSESDH